MARESQRTVLIDRESGIPAGVCYDERVLAELEKDSAVLNELMQPLKNVVLDDTVLGISESSGKAESFVNVHND